MAGKLLVRGWLEAARTTEASSASGGPVSGRRGAFFGLVVATTAGLTAASTVIPRGGWLLPVALVVVTLGWAVVGLLYGVMIIFGRAVRGAKLHVGALALAGLLLVGLVPATLSSTGWLLAAAFIGSGGLGGFGAARLAGPVSGRRPRWVAVLALATGIAGVAGVSAWVAAGGSRSVQEPFQVTGSMPLEVLHYGSGDHPRRAEFAVEVDAVTPPVDGSRFLQSWSGVHGWLRTRHWGFGPDRLPLNATVWLPQVDEPVPLVLIVHGNHSMHVASDLGHAWLAEELASYGYAVASVDQNFLNAGWLDFTDEYDARAWLLLEHLRLWRGWQDEADNPFHGRVNMDRVALIGHSRGGEAVAHAAHFDTLQRWPDDASVTVDAGFGIDAVVALAPGDGHYRPAGRATTLHDVSYLTIHPGRDGDHPAFHGLRQYERTSFGARANAVKAAVYLEDANHAHFNTAWGGVDLTGLRGRMLDNAAVMSGDAQRRDVATAVLAFLGPTLDDDRFGLAILHDPTHHAWSAATRVLTRYADSSDVVVADFTEDADPATGTLPGTRLTGSGFAVWREEPTPVRNGTLEAGSVRLGWVEEASEEPALSIVLPAGARLPDRPVLLLDLADPSGAANTVGVTVETRDVAGAVHRTTVGEHGGIPSAPQPRRLRSPLREPLPLLEPVAQTVRIPLEHQAALAEIRLVFDHAPRGAVRIDRIAIGTDP
jgi:hypothetical protein